MNRYVRVATAVRGLAAIEGAARTIGCGRNGKGALVAKGRGGGGWPIVV